MRFHLALFTVAAVAGVSSIQAQGVAGKWAVMWDADIRVDHDTAIVKSRKPATLQLTHRGDSVFGTWSGDLEKGVELRGTFDGKTVRLSSGTHERAGMRDGQPIKVMVRWDINGALQGSELKGTLFIYLGDRPAPVRRWDAKRMP